ncbi:PPE domain-containing protein [Saccharopolyspora gloriosae]|uniref:PPE domain-containing protein n=1 Tax=Saccharopolyspora gloriosae TaxID=455344 RepID=UPI00215ED936|nr:PPE domain-containing protein [Saccharopolyspora gloriosae]
MTQEDQGTGEATRAKLGTAAPGTDLVLRDTQNWSSRSHRELYEAVHNDNEPGRVGELAQDWSRMGTEIGDSSQRMAERLRGTEEGWQGEAAQSARGAIHELARWTSDAGNTAGDLGKRIGEQGQVMEAAKTSMPEPKDVEFKDEIVGVYGSLGRENGAGVLMGIVAAMKDMKQQQDKADSAHDQAVAVMERMESDSRVVDGSTPRFEPPPDPIRDGEKAGVKANSAFQPNGTPESTGSAGASGPGQAPGVQQPVTPGGEPSAPGAAVPPIDPQQGGAEATKRMAALNTPASNTSASAPQLEHTSQVSGDKGGSNQGAGARVPSLDGFGGGNNQGKSPVDRKNGPESTTSQGSGPKGKTSPNSVDPPTIKHRPVPKLESPDTPGAVRSRQVVAGPGKAPAAVLGRAAPGRAVVRAGAVRFRPSRARADPVRADRWVRVAPVDRRVRAVLVEPEARRVRAVPVVRTWVPAAVLRWARGRRAARPLVRPVAARPVQAPVPVLVVWVRRGRRPGAVVAVRTRNAGRSTWRARRSSKFRVRTCRRR